jgi:hypothetical protein
MTATTPDFSLSDLGVGSPDAVVLSGELAELLGRPVSPIGLCQHPTINSLVGFLTLSESEPAVDNGNSDDRASRDERIAVLGLGCRFPGGISRPEDGSPEVTEALARTTPRGSFLSDIDAFDAEFFEILLREPATMDPQQGLLLEVAHEASEHAGIPAHSLQQLIRYGIRRRGARHRTARGYAVPGANLRHVGHPGVSFGPEGIQGPDLNVQSRLPGRGNGQYTARTERCRDAGD